MSEDEDSQLKIELVEAAKSNLSTDDMCLIDIGTTILIWQSMSIVQAHLKAMGRQRNTQVQVQGLEQGVLNVR